MTARLVEEPTIDLAGMQRAKRQRLRAEMDRRGVDALWLMGPGHLRYAVGSGLLPTDAGRGTCQRVCAVPIHPAWRTTDLLDHALALRRRRRVRHQHKVERGRHLDGDGGIQYRLLRPRRLGLRHQLAPPIQFVLRAKQRVVERTLVRQEIDEAQVDPAVGHRVGDGAQ